MAKGRFFFSNSALKSTGIRLSYLYVYFVPNLLAGRPMHAFAVDDCRCHIVCNDLELHPLSRQMYCAF